MRSPVPMKTMGLLVAATAERAPPNRGKSKDYAVAQEGSGWVKRMALEVRG